MEKTPWILWLISFSREANLEMKIHPWTLSSITISQFHAKRSYALNLGMRFRHSHSWATTSATSWSVRALFEWGSLVLDNTRSRRIGGPRGCDLHNGHPSWGSTTRTWARRKKFLFHLNAFKYIPSFRASNLGGRAPRAPRDSLGTKTSRAPRDSPEASETKSLRAPPRRADRHEAPVRGINKSYLGAEL